MYPKNLLHLREVENQIADAKRAYLKGQSITDFVPSLEKMHYRSIPPLQEIDQRLDQANISFHRKTLLQKIAQLFPPEQKKDSLKVWQFYSEGLTRILAVRNFNHQSKSASLKKIADRKELLKLCAR